MKNRKFVWLASLLLTIPVYGTIIKGRVVDMDNNPIMFANIVLMNDSLFLTGTTTDEAGMFAIEDNQKADKVICSKTGYKNIAIPIDNSADLGRILMKKEDIILDEIVVNGTLPKSQIKGNAIVTKVQGTILSKMGNAFDVLIHTPMITGINGDLNVFGRGEPTVYINERMVRNQSDLQQLKAEDILSIELITNPGASFSSEINSVIKIKTLPHKGDGFGIDVTEAINIWSYARNTLDLNLRYRSNGWEIFGNINLYDGSKKYEDINEMTTFSKETFVQKLWNSSVLTTHKIFGKLGLSYTISPNHSLGAYFKIGKSNNKNDGNLDTQSYMKIDGTNTSLVNSYSNYYSTSRYYPSYEANAYYNGRIRDWSIDFNADFMQNNNTNEDHKTDYSSGKDMLEKYVLTNGLTQNRLIAEKLVASYPIWKGEIEIGEEYTGSKLSYQYNYEGAPIENSFTKINENNLATFACISQSFSEWNLSLGLRYEHADFEYRDDQHPEGALSREYNNLFPSFSLNTKIGKVRLTLDFTNKMKRPSYRKLDGGVTYVNLYVYQGGNPLLKPTRIYNLQAMGMWKYFYSLLMYNHELDAVFNTTRTYGDDPLVKILTFMNIPHYQYLQFTLGAQLSFGCWQPNPEIGLFKQFCSLNYKGIDTSFNKPIYSFTIDNVFSLPNNWQIGADLWFYSSANSQNCYIEPTQQINISIRKSFFNESLIFQLKAVDLLDRASNKVTIFSGDIKNYMYNHHEPRHITLTIKYSFNKSKSKYKGTGAGNKEKRRM